MFRVLENTHRLPILIELQTYFSDAVRVVNDRPLTTLSDSPNNLKPISPAFFLGEEVTPNSRMGEFQEKGVFRKNYVYFVNLANCFCGMKVFPPSIQ